MASNKELGALFINNYMKNRITPENIENLKDFQVFVFGSNLAGVHGAGAAALARSRGWALNGKGIGFWHMGNEASYAIPTKGMRIEVLSLEWIDYFVYYFIKDARSKPGWEFLVTEIGCGLAGYTPGEIAPMFEEALNVENIHLPQRFWDVLNK